MFQMATHQCYNTFVINNIFDPKEGMLPSITNGLVVERRRYKPRRKSPAIISNIEGLQLGVDGCQVLHGWVVDRSQNQGYPPILVRVVPNYDKARAITVVANISRFLAAVIVHANT